MTAAGFGRVLKGQARMVTGQVLKVDSGPYI